MISTKTSQAIVDIYPNNIQRAYHRGNCFYFNNYSCIYCSDSDWNAMFTLGLLKVRITGASFFRECLADIYDLANKLDIPVSTELNEVIVTAYPGNSFGCLVHQFNQKQKQRDRDMDNYCPL
jgi:hypothetical protein